MAPEVNANMAYEGDKADLFSAGVVLFIMLFQNPPFGTAEPSDGMFSAFSDPSKLCKFWETHHNSLTKKFQTISNSFKDFFLRICCPEPV